VKKILKKAANPQTYCDINTGDVAANLHLFIHTERIFRLTA